ncbi:MAG: [protein-PII] uridylyltransferase [Myxococcota bacterium]
MSGPPQIEAHFARLRRSAQDEPIEEKAVAGVVRDYVAAVRSFLRERHAAGESGQAVNEIHSDLMDQLVRCLFRFAEENYFAGEDTVQSDLCVLAVGGYARREMSIQSDVDLLFLYRDELTPHVAAVTERLQQWLWDAGLTVGGATRTIEDTLHLARKDATVRTAIVEPRFLIGSGLLFHDFAVKLRNEIFRDPARFITEQAEALTERHTRYGDSLYLLQPNLKDGAGGLRDGHVAYWAMLATQAGARGREDFLRLGLLTEDELEEYVAALDFLWCVRNELHLISGRRNDQMSFELQEKIAESFGYGRDLGERGELPVERFMGDYYRRARAVQNYSTLVIEQCQARVRRPARRGPSHPVEDGFRVAGEKLEIPHVRQLRERPLRLLSAFATAQGHDVPLTQKAGRLIRENLDLIDDEFRNSAQAARIFEEILNSERRVVSSLMAMNEVGLLARYLPEWDHIVCRWQQVVYHTYTVDVHSIFLVAELRRLWSGAYETGLPELTELMQGVDDRPVLFLGCLLHDIGKGTGADHSNEGAERARGCVERLGLSPDRVERVVFLVRRHLLMSHLAQRRDLSDPKLILEFARAVGDRTNLRNLYLLTFADIRASSASAWSDWKGQLLRELFERTSELLESGSDDPTKAIELLERRVETRRESAAAELESLGVARSSIHEYFEMMPRRYFIAHAPRQIARHALVVLGLREDRLLSMAVREMRGGFSEFILTTRDVRGLFANVAGTLTAHDLNVLGAHVYTARTGLALEVYRLGTPRGGDDERRLAWEEFEVSLRAVVSGEIGVKDLLRKRGRRVGVGAVPSREPASVQVSNDESDFYTIVDVAANDRLGLLYDLTRVIAKHRCEIYISKAATVLDQVTDTFYLKDGRGKKLDRSTCKRLQRALIEVVKAGEDSVGA